MTIVLWSGNVLDLEFRSASESGPQMDARNDYQTSQVC